MTDTDKIKLDGNQNQEKVEIVKIVLKSSLINFILGF